LKNYEPHEGYWPTQFLPALREQAKKKFADVLANDPDLARRVEALEAEQYADIT
jgi:hypothetical protein